EALANASEQTQLLLGGPAEIVQHHLGGLDLLVVQAASLQGRTAQAMFLLGMVAARRGLFSTLPERTRLLRWVQIIGFPVGLAGGLIYALLGADANTLATAVSVVTAPFLTAAYVATLVRLMHRDCRIRSALAPAGRIALTIYLAQSAIWAVLFTGVALGLAGQVSPPLLTLTALAVFAGLAA